MIHALVIGNIQHIGLVSYDTGLVCGYQYLAETVISNYHTRRRDKMTGIKIPMETSVSVQLFITWIVGILNLLVCTRLAVDIL